MKLVVDNEIPSMAIPVVMANSLIPTPNKHIKQHKATKQNNHSTGLCVSL